MRKSANEKRISPASGLRFGKGAKFSGISISKAIPILLDPAKHKKGHVGVLTAGLCAWLLRPRASRYIANIMLVQSARMIAFEERKIEKKVVKRDAFNLSVLLRPRTKYLFEELFYPMGGMAALIRIPFEARKREENLNKAEREVRFLLLLTSVLHAYHGLLADAKQSETSYRIDKAAIVVTRLDLMSSYYKSSKKKKNYTPKYVRDLLRRHAPSLAFIYAATTVPYDDERTTADALLSGSYELGKISKSLPSLFARAAFIDTEILQHVTFGKPGGNSHRWSSDFEPLPGVAPEYFNATSFSREQLSEIERIFG